MLLFIAALGASIFSIFAASAKTADAQIANAAAKAIVISLKFPIKFVYITFFRIRVFGKEFYSKLFAARTVVFLAQWNSRRKTF